MTMIGEIRLFASTFAPLGWVACDGRLVAVRTYPQLAALIGNRYGGDPGVTIKLPDLRGGALTGVPADMPGHWLGLWNDPLDGTECDLLSLPSHSHQVRVGVAKPSKMHASPQPGDGLSRLASTTAVVAGFAAPTNLFPMRDVVQFSGTGPMPTYIPMQPYLALNAYICASGGDFPMRP